MMSDLFTLRRFSWLESNRRVLAQVQDSRVSLRERMKFLAILSSNIDEFFMVHGGHLASGTAAGDDEMAHRSAGKDLAARLRQLIDEHHRYFLDELQPRLAVDGIVVLRPEDTSEAQRRFLGEYFRRAILPALTPLAIDPGHPFPHLRHGSVYLAARLTTPEQSTLSDFPHARLSMIHVPNSVLPRFISLPDPRIPHAFILLDHVIQIHLSALYREYEVLSSHTVRVTRSSARPRPSRSGEERSIPSGPAVRLEHDEDLPADILAILLDELALTGESAYAGRGFAAFGDLFQLYAAVSPPQLAPAPPPCARPSRAAAPDIWSVTQIDDAAREASRPVEAAEAAHNGERWGRWR
jgi:polyphosphate kinase